MPWLQGWRRVGGSGGAVAAVLSVATQPRHTDVGSSAPGGRGGSTVFSGVGGGGAGQTEAVPAQIEKEDMCYALQNLSFPVKLRRPPSDELI